MRIDQATCSSFDRGECRSCSLLELPGEKRAAHKAKSFEQALSGIDAPSPLPLWQPLQVFPSRSKAKFSVTGTMKAPVIGLLDGALNSTELLDCPLHLPELNAVARTLKQLITEFKVPPYHIERRQGELKGILLKANESASQVLVRLVLRSEDALPKIKRLARALIEEHPFVKVVTANIQPVPAAILEGPNDIYLTDERLIWENFGSFRLAFQPQSFSQVTHETAAALYAYVAKLVASSGARSLFDFFCGVGGFSFAASPHLDWGLGIELSTLAIESARLAKIENKKMNLDFESGDVEEFLSKPPKRIPDGILFNPPRRGLSPSIIEKTKKLSPKNIFYSSCNPETLIRDLKLFLESSGSEYRVLSLAPFDMFPLTEHLEVVAHLGK